MADPIEELLKKISGRKEQPAPQPAKRAEKKPDFVQDLVNKISGKKEQPAPRPAQQPAPAPSAPPAGVQSVEKFGHRFQHSPGDPVGVWINESEHIAYIDNADVFIDNGGKLEHRPVTSNMDPYIYKVYSPHGYEQQLAYYKPENLLISLVEDPFAKYRQKPKWEANERYKYKVIAAYQRMTGKEVYGSQFNEVILPDLEKRGMTTDELIEKYGQSGD